MKGATVADAGPAYGRVVSIHAPVKGATDRVDRDHADARFNPRAREGRDQGVDARNGHRTTSFNPRAREGRDLSSRAAIVVDRTSFNPRAREGRDYAGLMTVPYMARVSIHAPVKGATRSRGDGHGAGCGFNPRAREGRDRRPPRRFSASILVSIHAPVKGATT